MMLQFLTDPFWIANILGALAGIITAAIPLFQILTSRSRKELTYKILSSASLVHTSAQNTVKISLNDGSFIPDADLLVLRIRNTGNTNITNQDYIKPITFLFAEREIIDVTEVKTEPSAGLVDRKDVETSPRGKIPGEVIISRPELNKKTSLTLSILLRGIRGSDRGITHLGGLRDGDVKPYQAQRGLSRRSVFVGIGIFLILFSLGIASLRTVLTTSSSDSNCVSGSIAIGGSTALLPLVSQMAQVYHEMCPHAIISINQNVASSKAGLSALEAGNTQIGDTDLLSSNLSLTDHQVAAVTYVMIVNLGVSQVANLSMMQIQNIYTGSITNWADVGGPNLPIVVINRTTTSGTRATFEKYILGKKMTTSPPNYDEEDTSGLMAQKVANTPGAIGYLDLRDAIITQNLKPLTIDGIQAVPANVKDNSYPFWTIEHMYTQGNPSDLTNAFIQYITRNDLKAQISNLDYIPFNDMPPAIINHHPSPIAPENL